PHHPQQSLQHRSVLSENHRRTHDGILKSAGSDDLLSVPLCLAVMVMVQAGKFCGDCTNVEEVSDSGVLAPLNQRPGSLRGYAKVLSGAAFTGKSRHVHHGIAPRQDLAKARGIEKIAAKPAEWSGILRQAAGSRQAVDGVRIAVFQTFLNPSSKVSIGPRD